MTMIYLDDLRLNAVVEGPTNGAPLVLIHALGTDLTIWDQVIPLLPKGLRILRYDQRGHGASDVPAAPYTMGALIRDAERLIDHVGMKDAVVIGVSLGGLVTQGLATKRLDQVRAMVLSNTAAKIGNPEMWQTRIEEMRVKGVDAYVDGAMERIFGRKFREIPQMQSARRLLLQMNIEGWAGCAAAIAGTDFYTTTAALTLPTLVIAGTNDGSTPPDLVRETAELIRGHRYALMRGTGHLPMLDKPAEFSALLTGFLQDIGHI
ncbi:MAG: 3-oxoadipate enol-lactonase [Pseudomonadota bacterium]